MSKHDLLPIEDEDALIKALESVPLLEMPEEGARAILEHTAMASRAPLRDSIRFPLVARWLAAAVILFAASTMTYLSLAPANPSRAEAEEAARQLRLVLASTSSAIQRANASGVSQVMSRGVAPATRRAPFPDPNDARLTPTLMEHN